jgi:chromosome segregation ATPase
MAMESVDVRLARLEGGYQQIDRRLGSIEDRLGRLETKVDAAVDRLDAKIDAQGNALGARIDALGVDLRRELAATNARIDAQGHALGARIDDLNRVLSGRIHMLLYGIIIAVLVPILIRIFFT